MTRFIVVFSLVALLLPAATSAQEAGPKWAETVPAVSGYVAPTIVAPLSSTTSIARLRNAGNEEIRKAMEAIKNAESESDKEDAKDDLKDLLEKQYVESLDRY